MEFVPKEIQEEVNVTPIHPFQYFAKVGLILAFWGIVLYLITGAIADQLTKSLKPSLEASIGKSLVAPLTKETIRPDTERQLQSLLDELQSQTNSRSPKAEIHIIDSEQINAGALPGGQIIITTGLIDEATSENELVFVLAHELGHHQLRHPLRGLGRSLLWRLVLSVLGVGQQGGSVLTQTESFTRTIANLQFSRGQEQRSDQFALEAIHNRYGHIDHALDFFQRLEDKNKDPIGRKFQLEFLETHPFPATRIQDLQSYARQRNWSLTGQKTELAPQITSLNE